MIQYGELHKRMSDRYEGNIEELCEVLQITIADLVDAFYDRIEILLEDLDINASEE